MPRTTLGQNPHTKNDIDIIYRIKAERDKKGWSDETLAIKLHCNVRTLQRRYVEPSKFTLADFRKMAGIFKMRVVDIIE